MKGHPRADHCSGRRSAEKAVALDQTACARRGARRQSRRRNRRCPRRRPTLDARRNSGMQAISAPPKITRHASSTRCAGAELGDGRAFERARRRCGPAVRARPRTARRVSRQGTRVGVRRRARASVAELSDHHLTVSDPRGDRRARRDLRLHRSALNADSTTADSISPRSGSRSASDRRSPCSLFSLLHPRRTLAASEGRTYNYPFAIRFLR